MYLWRFLVVTVNCLPVELRISCKFFKVIHERCDTIFCDGDGFPVPLFAQSFY